MRADSPAARITPQKLGERAIVCKINKYVTISAHFASRTSSKREAVYTLASECAHEDTHWRGCFGVCHLVLRTKRNAEVVLQIALAEAGLDIPAGSTTIMTSTKKGNRMMMDPN
jgi:hypothetical protein